MDKDWERLQHSDRQYAGMECLNSAEYVRQVSANWVVQFNYRYYQILPVSRDVDLRGQKIKVRCDKSGAIFLLRSDGTALLFDLLKKKPPRIK